MDNFPTLCLGFCSHFSRLALILLLFCSCLGLFSHSAEVCWVWSSELGSLLGAWTCNSTNSLYFFFIFIKVCSFNVSAMLDILLLAFLGFALHHGLEVLAGTLVIWDI